MGRAKGKAAASDVESRPASLPPAEEIAALKVKHGEIFHVDFGRGGFIHRKPSQAETDAYLLAGVKNERNAGGGNLIFAVRVWPSVEALEQQFEEAPAVVKECAEQVISTVGGDDATVMAVTALNELKHMSEEDRAELEARCGQKLDLIENAHPRGCLRYVRLPGIGVSIFRRPTRTSFTMFADNNTGDDVMSSCRDLCAETAITDAKALPSLFSTHPVVSFHLAFALGALAGYHLEVKSGKL